MTTQTPVKDPTTSVGKNDSAPLASVWLTACTVNDLVLGSGICVLIENKQIAIYALLGTDKTLVMYASDNYDPIGQANVMSRGILCSIAGKPNICSPLHKQHYDLETGQCLEDEAVSIGIYGVKQSGDDVLVNVPVVAAQ